MKLIILSFILFLTTPFCKAQKSESDLRIDSISTERFSLNASPLSVLDMYNGSAYRFGAQYRLFNQFSIGAEGGGYIEPLTQALSGFFDIKGFHWRGRISHSPVKLTNWCFGLEYQYKEQEFSYLDSTEAQNSFQAEVSKKVHCTNMFVAYDHHLTDRVFFDFQVGLGIRFRDVFNTQSDSVGEDSTLFPWDSMNNGRVKTGESFLPNFSLTMRIGYVLVKY